MLEPTIITWIFIIFVVKPNWIKVPAEEYALQLIEALNVMDK